MDSGDAYLGACVLGVYVHTMDSPNRVWYHVGSAKVPPRIESYGEGSSIQQPPEIVDAFLYSMQNLRGEVALLCDACPKKSRLYSLRATV